MKKATAKTAAKSKKAAASVKSPGKSHAPVWDEDKFNKAVALDNYIQIFISDDNRVQRKFNTLKLSGAAAQWKKKPNFVYEPVSRVAGEREAVERFLAAEIGRIQQVTGTEDDEDTLLSNAYSVDHKGSAFKEAAERAKTAKKAKLDARNSAEPTGEFNLADVNYIWRAFAPKGKVVTATVKKPAAKKGKRSGIAWMLSKARFDEKNEDLVLDLTKMTASGTGIKPIPRVQAEKKKLGTVSGIDGFLLYAPNDDKGATLFEQAIELLAPEFPYYRQLSGKFGQEVSGNLANLLTEQRLAKEKKLFEDKVGDAGTVATEEVVEEEEVEETPAPKPKASAKPKPKASAKPKAAATRTSTSPAASTRRESQSPRTSAAKPAAEEIPDAEPRRSKPAAPAAEEGAVGTAVARRTIARKGAAKTGAKRAASGVGSPDKSGDEANA